MTNNYLLIFFIIVHIFLSLDFGCVYCASTKIDRLISGLTLLFCLFSSLCTCALYQVLDQSKSVSQMWIIAGLMHYFLNSLFLVIFRRKNSFYNLQRSLMCIDSKLLTDSTAYKIDVKIILSCVCVILYKVFLNIIFCINNNEDCILVLHAGAYLYTYQIYSFDVVMLISFFTYYSVYCRVKTLIRVIISNKRDIAYCLDIYRNIIKSVDAAKKCFDFLYVIALTIFIPDMILQFYVTLTKWKLNGFEGHILIVRYLYTIQNFMLLCSPAIAADLVTSTAEELNLLLHNKLLLTRDEEQAASLERFLSYISGHSLKFTIFKIVPLDWTLPVIILNLCISYQIIIVQLTKLY